MESRVYDAIIIGAGHNGLCLATYLQRAGLSTAIVERRHEEGGGANTEEPLLAGYRHNMHANYLAFFDVMPMVRDFGLDELGLRTIKPEAQHGIAFADGRPPVILHRFDLIDRTHASIARYSKSDADLYVELKKRAMQLEEMLAFGIYNPPSGAWFDAQASALDAYADLGITQNFAMKSPKNVIDELFESPEMRTLLYQDAVEFGLPIDGIGLGAGFVIFLMWTTANWQLPVGGMHSVAKALMQACYREGVDLIENTDVERVIIESGRAAGVLTRHGEIRANRLVASNADAKQTLLDLVGEEHLSPLWARRAKAFRYGPSHTVASPMFCLREPPAYTSARWDPDIDRCFHTVVGFDDPDEAVRHMREAFSGRLPEMPAAGTWVNSLWDPSQAPPGSHVAGGWYFFPSARFLSAEEWADVRATYNDRFLARWAEAAPNMTRANVIADVLYTPDQMERKVLFREGDCSNGEIAPDQFGPNRPFPEASQYRTEVDALYLCGPSTYPAGGIHGACGYNAYKAIAEDLALPSPVPEGRMY